MLVKEALNSTVLGDGDETSRYFRGLDLNSSSPASEVERVAQRYAPLRYFEKPSTWIQFAQPSTIVRQLLKGRHPDQNENASTGSTAGGTA
jgi:hypothetical protein